MTDESKLYPGLYDNQYEFHLAEIKRLRDQLQDDVLTFTKKRDRYKELHKLALGFNLNGSTISLITGGTSIAALTGGITAALALPLGCISIGSLIITSLSTYLMKVSSKGKEKIFKTH